MGGYIKMALCSGRLYKNQNRENKIIKIEVHVSDVNFNT